MREPTHAEQHQSRPTPQGVKVTKPPRPCSRRTSACEPRGVQREHGAALATNGNLVTGAADAHDGTGRAEEGGQHLFLAVSTIIRTHAGVVDEYELVSLCHDITPDPRLMSDPSLSKGHLLASHRVFARTGSQIPQKCLSAVCRDELCRLRDERCPVLRKLHFDDWTAAQVFGTNVTILSCPHFLTCPLSSPRLSREGVGKTVTLKVLPTQWHKPTKVPVAFQGVEAFSGRRPQLDLAVSTSAAADKLRAIWSPFHAQDCATAHNRLLQ